MTPLLRNGEQLEQFTRVGGVALMVNGRPKLQPCTAATAVQLAQARSFPPIAQLIICCKAQQTAAAFAGVVDLLAPDATVLLLQNGMGVAEELLLVRPGLKLFCGVSTDGAHLVAPFTVQRAGVGTTQIGLFPEDPAMALSRELCQRLEVSGLTLAPCADIRLAQWQKLAVNAVINPLTALYDISNGGLLTLTEPKSLIAPLCAEIAGIASAEGIALDPKSIEDNVHRICQLTSANVSSMLQDVRRGRDTELDYINGFLLRCAARQEVDAPLNQQLIARLRARQSPAPGAGRD